MDAKETRVIPVKKVILDIILLMCGKFCCCNLFITYIIWSFTTTNFNFMFCFPLMTFCNYFT